MPDTCALDVADRGEHTLEELGQTLGMTYTAVRKIVMRGVQKILKTKEAEGWKAERATEG